MNGITRTSLNSDAVQHFYEQKLAEKTPHVKLTGQKSVQNGSVFFLDAVTGLIDNVGKAVRIGQKKSDRRAQKQQNMAREKAAQARQRNRATEKKANVDEGTYKKENSEQESHS